MIFITVGTSQYPFDRLLKAIDDGVRRGRIDQPTFAQSGSSHYRPQYYDYEDFLSFDRMLWHIQKADIVVAHAGVGSMLLCLSLGKIPILFPRQRDRNASELMDNHQIDWARRMESQEKVLVAYDDQELLDKIVNYSQIVNTLMQRELSSNEENLVHFLKTFIENNGSVICEDIPHD